MARGSGKSCTTQAGSRGAPAAASTYSTGDEAYIAERLAEGNLSFRRRTIGAIYPFEYHCLEDESSTDAELWHHTHQAALVLSELGPNDVDLECGLMYEVRFPDGFTYQVNADELCDSEAEWTQEDYVPKIGQVPRDQLVYIAEGAMERGSFTGKTWVTPHGHLDKDPAIRASMAAMSAWLTEATGLDYVRVSVSDWETTRVGVTASTQTVTRTIFVQHEVTALTLLHEAAHLLRDSRSGDGHDAQWCEIAERLYREQLGDEAADCFHAIITPPTA
jgi:hypothetical protein